MSKIRLIVATALAASSIVIAAPVAHASCQGPDGQPCPGARECQSINALWAKTHKGEELLACPS